jgi:hypothetical protein
MKTNIRNLISVVAALMFSLSILSCTTTKEKKVETAETDTTAPVAEAGLDQNLSLNSTVTLDGSGSSDADGDTLFFSWSITSKPLESSASLSDLTAVNPTFTADV